MKNDPQDAIARPDGVGIRLANDITIDVAAAAYMADLIDLTRRLLARQNGSPQLGERADAIERRLRECVGLRAAYADTSTKVSAHQDVLPYVAEWVTAKAAAAELGITPTAVRQHCSNGKLGQKVGDRWAIDREELEMFKRARAV